ncbi:MAG: outer membrane beta-barrel protein [Crocinitomicaceae bacterium]
MKKIYTLFILLSCSTIGLAQEEEKKGRDTTRFNIGKTEFIIIDNDTVQVDDMEDPDGEGDKSWREESDLTYWSGFEVGVNILMNNQFEPNFSESHLQIDPANSFVYNFNILEKRLRFGTDHIGLVTGLGFTNSRFGFKNSSLRLVSNNDTTMGVVDSSLVSGFSKNQLRVNYLNIPLLIQINTSKNPDKNFHLAFGAIGGVRIGTNVKYKYEAGNGGDSKERIKGRYNVNPFHVSLTARMGYKNFGVFANYNMLPLFENQASRVAKPLTFGASFHF